MEKCRGVLSAAVASGDVAIPQVVGSLSTHRILTMSFEEGISIGDLHKIYSNKDPGGRKLSYAAADVAYLISKTFSDQM